MLDADEAYFKEHGEPLFSSHMLDLSEESKEDNIADCVKYFKRMAPIKLWLEMEIGITGGEEDGVNNENVDNASLYTQPEDIVCLLFQKRNKICSIFLLSGIFTRHCLPFHQIFPLLPPLVTYMVSTVSNKHPCAEEDVR